MSKVRCLAPLLLALLGTSAAAGDGLKVNASDFWLGVQANIRFNATLLAAEPLRLGQQAGLDSSRPPLGASLVGDYYFTGDSQAPGLARSGFRASSGLLIRQPGVSLSEVAWASRSSSTFGVPSRLPYAPAGYREGPDYSFGTVPYLGIGYSGISEKSGWGFWADVGMVVQQPGGALGFGRAVSGSQSLDDVVRDLRLAPMVQLGVNYSF